MTSRSKLKEVLVRLRREKAAFQAQTKLLEHFLVMARSSAEERVLHSILQETLQIAVELTSAEKGSLFLLDASGKVTDSILTRGERTSEESAAIIGKVMDRGLAAWVREHHRVGLILDTAEDKRWLHLPDQPYEVRSAMAVPIQRGPDLLGLLTLLHAEPHRFSHEAAELMELTATLIGVTLENARLYAALQKYSRKLDAELEKGKKIQQQFLPARLPQPPGWEIAATFLPASRVSGDFYDAFMLPCNRLCIVIGDVCDKGVGSALFMALIRSLIRVLSGKSSVEGLSAGATEKHRIDIEALTAFNAVTGTNDYIAGEHGEGGMFASLFVGVLDPETGRLAYVNGGHEPPLIIAEARVRQRLIATGPVVGALPNSRFEVGTADIRPGETLVGYTDGVTEAMSPEQTLFGRTRFNALACLGRASASGLIDCIRAELFAHIQEAPQHDDITLLAVYRFGVEDKRQMLPPTL
jgi:sigma-B regulation protein RsbU (phosphoserine phosphatase)